MPTISFKDHLTFLVNIASQPISLKILTLMACSFKNHLTAWEPEIISSNQNLHIFSQRLLDISQIPNHLWPEGQVVQMWSTPSLSISARQSHDFCDYSFWNSRFWSNLNLSRASKNNTFVKLHTLERLWPKKLTSQNRVFKSEKSSQSPLQQQQQL